MATPDPFADLIPEKDPFADLIPHKVMDEDEEEFKKNEALLLKEFEKFQKEETQKELGPFKNIVEESNPFADVPTTEQVKETKVLAAIAAAPDKKEASWAETLLSLPSVIKESLTEAFGAGLRLFGETGAARAESNPLYNLEAFNSGILKKIKDIDQQLGKDISSYGTEIAREAKDRLEEAMPENMTFWQKAVVDASISTGHVVPGAMISLLTKSPTPMLATMGLDTMSTSYNNARENGLDEVSALRYAAIDGAIEVATETIPAKILFKSGTGPFKRLVNFLAAELPGENIATITQTLNAQLHDLEGDLTADEWLQRLAETSAATLISGGIQSGGASIIHKIAGGQDAIAQGEIERSDSLQYQETEGGEVRPETSSSDSIVESEQVQEVKLKTVDEIKQSSFEKLTKSVNKEKPADYIPPKETPAFPEDTPPIVEPRPESQDRSKPYVFANEATEKDIRTAQKGLQKEGFLKRTYTKIEESIEGAKESISRHYKFIPHNDPEYAGVIVELRKIEDAHAVSEEESGEKVYNIVKEFNLIQQDDFNLKVVLDDALYNLDPNREEPLPWNMTEPELIQAHADITARVNADPMVKNAIERRNNMIKELGNALVEAGVLSKEQLTIKNYFRHQVLEYAYLQDSIRKAKNQTGRSKGKVKKPKPGYRFGRTENDMAYNLNYVQVEYDYMREALADVKIAKAIRNIDRMKNVVESHKQNIREMNGSKLDGLIANGKINLTAEELSQFESMKDSGATRSMDKFLKEKLGSKYTEWDNARVIPEGYRLWSEEPGKLYFTGNSIGKRAIDILEEQAAKNYADIGLTAKQAQEVVDSLKKAVMVAGEKPRMLLPTGLADQLDQLSTRVDRTGIMKVIATGTRYWKIWTLFNPRGVVKYFWNNLSGDMDAAIAGNPRTLRKVIQASKELIDIFYNNATPKQTYIDAREHGVFAAGLSAQELPDINQLDKFRHLSGEKPSLNVFMRYWNSVKKFNIFRENIFRYATYLDLKERLDKGEHVGYGASIPAMVDAQRNNIEKAALLAREIIGDYGNLSETGTQLRETIYPFFSWVEINLKRYARLTKNAYTEGVGKGLKQTGAIGAVLGVKTSAYLFTRIMIMTGLLELWNNTFFGDEEDELPDDIKSRPHLIVGITDEGKTIVLPFPGAVSDVFSWFGFQDAAMVLDQVERGRATGEDVLKAIAKAPVNKFVGGITPVIKAPLEVGVGISLYPDFFNPRAGDRGKIAMRLIAMEPEYDLLTGAPTKGWLTQSVEKANIAKIKDPNETAYYKIKNMVRDFRKQESEVEGFSTFSTPKSNLIRLYKTAIRLNDETALKEIRRQMREAKITSGEIEKAIKRLHPLADLSKVQRPKFLRSLSSEERKLLTKAERYYYSTYR